MMTWLREKFGTLIIGAIMGFIAFVFVFSGVFSPKATRGLHEGAVAGTINGERITISEFNRELNRRIEYFKNLGGGKISEEQLKAFRIRELVFNDLAARKAMIQEAEKRGLVPSDEEVRDQIKTIPAFQKNGNFDLVTYKQTLESNNYTPASFEKAVREDLSQQKWKEFFKDRVRVSEEEVKREFLMSHDKRNVKYVVLTTDAIKKDIPVQDKEIDAFLANPVQLKQAQAKYEAGQKTLYQGQKFEDVQRSLARSILATQKVEEAQKLMQSLSEQVVAKLGADKASDGKVNALLKPYGLEVKQTGMLNRETLAIPAYGDSSEVAKDAFNAKSPIDTKTGGKPKVYMLAGKSLIAIVSESQKPDINQLGKDRDTVMGQVLGQKMQTLYSNFVQELMGKAKIEPNPSVLSDKES